MATAVQPFECFSTLIDRHHGPAASLHENEDYKIACKLTKFSSSKPLDERLWFRKPHTKTHLKPHVRSGVLPQVRRGYWLAMLEVKDEDVTLYSRAIGQPEENHASSTPTHNVPAGLPSFSHGPGFKSAYHRLTKHLPSDCPLVPVLAHVFLHLLEEWECYVGLQNLLKRQCWIDRNSIEEKASLLTLIKLISTRLRTISFSSLKPVGMGEDIFVKQLLSGWCFWPFLNQPFWIVVRIVDLYLLEGPKMLYRLALAAIRLFTDSPLCEGYRLLDISLDQYISHYLSTLSPEQCSQWIDDAIGINHLPWDGIFKNWLYNCSLAQQENQSSMAQYFASTSIRENSAAAITRKSQKRSVSLDPVSDILTKSLLDDLVSWFPDWALGDTVECVFKASKHGYNLRTLYYRCELEEPLILVVKTQQDAIFGAFIVGSLRDRRNNTFFGSGETFLFTLEPRPQCYQWTAESDLILRGNDEEIIVGSGGGQYGLWIDGELNRGSTATCAAYDNPPLTGSEDNDFHCSAIEVFILTSQQH